MKPVKGCEQELKIRAVTTGAAPQELVEMVRQNMDPQDQGATDGKLTYARLRQDLSDEQRRSAKLLKQQTS